MSLQKEIWLPVIENNLFAAWEKLTQLGKDDNNFVVKDASSRYYKVYIPQAGSMDGVVVNPTSYPLSVSERTDDTLDYSLDHLAMKPIRLGAWDTSLLSYDKMQSILVDFAGNIGEAQLYKTFVNWYVNGGTAAKRVLTGGASMGASSAPSSTTNVKKLLLTDIIKGAAILDKQNIPNDGKRKAILPVDMFYQLHEDMLTGSYNINIIEKDGLTMLSQPIAGFQIHMFPKVVNVVETTYAVRAFDHVGAATDREAGLLFHQDMVSVAKGDLNVYVNDGDPTMLGDVLSAEAWIGGKYRRKDTLGVVPIIQANA